MKIYCEPYRKIAMPVDCACLTAGWPENKFAPCRKMALPVDFVLSKPYCPVTPSTDVSMAPTLESRSRSERIAKKLIMQFETVPCECCK